MSRTKKPKLTFVLFRNGVACGFADPCSVGLGYTLASGHRVVSKLVSKDGVLMPGVTPIAEFKTELRAQREVKRLDRIVSKLRGTMVDELPALRPLLAPGVIEYRKIWGKAVAL